MKKTGFAAVSALLVLLPALSAAQEKAAPKSAREAARAHFEAGRYEQAWAAYEKAVEAAPGDPELLNEYAWNLVTFKGATPEHGKRALPFAEAAVRAAPRNAGILDTLAEAYFVAGDTAKAMELNAQCRSMSQSGEYYPSLARYAERRITEMEAMKIPAGERAAVYALLAEAYLSQRPQLADKAAEAAKKALELDPETPGASGILGRILLAKGEKAAAAKALEKELSKPGAAGDARLNAALGYALLDGEAADQAKALKQFRKALALDPGRRRDREGLCRALIGTGDCEAAVREASLAMSMIDDRWQPEFYREPLLVLTAQALEKLGRNEEAAEFYLQSLLQRGNDPEADKGLERACRAIDPKGTPPRERFAARNKVSTPFFDEATEKWGLAKAGGRRVAFGDADGDGKPDLFFGPNLWLNRGGGFENATGAAGLLKAPGAGALLADVDNDGDLDLFLMSHGKTAGTGDLLYLNDGKGVFIWRAAAGVTDLEPTEGAGFGDFDLDGNIDLYVANYEGPMSVGHPDFLYRGRGDGSFEDVSVKAGIRVPKNLCGRGVNWGDFDNDGDLDIHVSNYRLNPNFLWRNNGDGTFTNVAAECGVEGVLVRGYYGHTIGSDFGDIDNDGDLDLFQANLAHPRFIEFSNQSVMGINSGGRTPSFADEFRARGIKYEETHSDPVFADFDNDGFLDLYVTSVYEGRKSFLYRNRGDGTFEDVTWYSGTRVDNGWGCAVADADADGDLDLLACGGKGPQLFLNRGNDNSWLRVKVAAGKGSNGAAIGARVSISTEDGRVQVREVKGGRGTTNQDELTVHFGLGSYGGKVDVFVRFPSKPPVIRMWQGVEARQVFTARQED